MFRTLPRISTFHYQCSKKSTSKEISSVFEKAINRQRKADHRKHRSLVFMDEAGLPEEEKESLKVLHYFLEGHMSTKAECGFVAITNHVLDAAKSNRCLSLLRQEPMSTEMIEITKGVLFETVYATRVRYGTVMITGEDFSLKLSTTYTLLQRQPWFEHFYGLRDFIFFVKAIRTLAVVEKDIMITNAQLIIRSCERNFGGLGMEKLHEIIHAFMTALPGAEARELRDQIDVLKECLGSKNEHISINLRPRYKLIIDDTDDDSILRILSVKGYLPFSERMALSSFPDDSDLERANYVSKVKLVASHSNRVILSRADPVHECFYDLFNQNFRSLRNRDGALIFYSNIAIGGVSRRSKVHPDFECIVHVRGCDVPSLPAPFLNRFEKYRIDIKSARCHFTRELPTVKRILVAAENEVCHFIQDCSLRIGKKWIVGFVDDQTIPSLLLELVPSKAWAEFCEEEDAFHSTDHKLGYGRVSQFVKWITGDRITVDETECLRVYYAMKEMNLLDNAGDGPDHLIEVGNPSILIFKLANEGIVPRETSYPVERVASGIISREIILRLLPLATPESIYELRYGRGILC